MEESVVIAGGEYIFIILCASLLLVLVLLLLPPPPLILANNDDVVDGIPLLLLLLVLFSKLPVLNKTTAPTIAVTNPVATAFAPVLTNDFDDDAAADEDEDGKQSPNKAIFASNMLHIAEKIQYGHTNDDDDDPSPPPINVGSITPNNNVIKNTEKQRFLTLMLLKFLQDKVLDW